jgi:P27 family predicted phage terminase small subunit
MSDVPDALGPRGAALWASIMSDLEGDQHDADLVLETCRILDVIDALAAAVDRDGVTVTGSRGQIVINPAVQEMRQQQVTFSRLVGQLNLDEAELGAMLTARQASAKRAGQQKWRKLNEVRRGSA